MASYLKQLSYLSYLEYHKSLLSTQITVTQEGYFLVARLLSLVGYCDEVFWWLVPTTLHKSTRIVTE
jgi:hypothetical protein